MRYARIIPDRSGRWTALLWDENNRVPLKAVGFPTVQAAVRRSEHWLDGEPTIIRRVTDETAN